MNKKKSFLEEYIDKSQKYVNSKLNLDRWCTHLENMSNISLKDLLDLKEKYILRVPRLIMPSSSFPLTLYRARVISESSEEDLSDPRTFSYPPLSYTTSYQRANVPGYPVFYGSLDAKTAVEELRVNGAPIKEGDTIFLSEWKIKDGIKSNLCHLSIPDIKDETQLYSGITKHLYSEIIRIFKETKDPFYIREQKYLYEQFSRLFLVGTYIQSGFIAYDILYNTPPIKGIIINGLLYPSCSNNYRSVNCALLPDFVDQCMELLSVQKITLTNYSDDGMHTTSNYFGTITENKINWYAYISELNTKDYKVEVAFEHDWTDEQIESSKFFIHEKLIDLYNYCSEIANKIDLTDQEIPEKYTSHYKIGIDLFYIHETTFDINVAKFILEDLENNISAIRILVPLKGYTKEVTSKEVYDL